MAAVARVFRGSRFLMSPAPGAAAAAAGAKKAAAPQVTKADATAAKEKRGIMKPLPVSEEMRRFAGGAPEIARAQAVKLIWAHIKANGLQNPVKKTEINCDATLKSLFGGRDKVGMLEIGKLINPHFLKN
ncbi:protein TRI1-like [Panicum miliaceum]|uniref:Protein TRI1-like n=1 Tax=Panicum miliaceum TaxID=4540 RepID=A0A3L6RP53_PANMI|nr:protein TRI1-like [Panicum miliaceum]